MSESTTGRGVQSLDRAIEILRTFTAETPELGVSEIARKVGLTTSTTHRLLATLSRHGIVRKSDANAKYALGPELLRLAHATHQTLKLTDLARPVMASLRDAAEETVGLHVADITPSRIVIEQVESRHALRRTYTEIGIPVPIHEGAPGKVLLSSLPQAVIEEVLSRPLARATRNTIVDPPALRKELERVREEGYALSIEERVPGISTVAVPVLGFDGRVVAALSVSGPSIRMDPDRLLQLVPVARVAGERLSKMLGFRADDDPAAGVAAD